jgi:hypothetical protein
MTRLGSGETLMRALSKKNLNFWSLNLKVRQSRNQVSARKRKTSSKQFLQMKNLPTITQMTLWTLLPEESEKKDLGRKQKLMVLLWQRKPQKSKRLVKSKTQVEELTSMMMISRQIRKETMN